MSVEVLRDEVSCSICLELFQDPVSIHCGHSFCQTCITRHWEGRTTYFSCPRCRETKKTETEKQKIVTEYKELHKFLEEQESFLQAQLEQLHTEIMNTHEENLTRLSEETTSLGTLIGEMERMCQQPDCELLKDIKTTLSRCKRETFSQFLDIFSPELEEEFCDFTKKTADIKEAMEKCQGTLEELNLPLITQVTLDPNTAHAELYLSEDCRVVRWEPQEQDLPRNPERFKLYCCVLGLRGFRWGWHSWEVEVSREDMWAIGVAKESVPRESFFLLEPKEGIWAMCHIGEEYETLTSSCNTRLTLRNVPQRIRVFLDCQEGKVEFYDAVSKDQTFAFPRGSFKGEKVYPWFMVLRDAHLKLVFQGTGEKKNTTPSTHP
ncbi:zinc finger protein RFP-like [Pterocles gutturalis]